MELALLYQISSYFSMTSQEHQSVTALLLTIYFPSSNIFLAEMVRKVSKSGNTRNSSAVKALKDTSPSKP